MWNVLADIRKHGGGLRRSKGKEDKLQKIEDKKFEIGMDRV